MYLSAKYEFSLIWQIFLRNYADNHIHIKTVGGKRFVISCSSR